MPRAADDGRGSGKRLLWLPRSEAGARDGDGAGARRAVALRIPTSLLLAGPLVEELANFRVKISAGGPRHLRRRRRLARRQPRRPTCWRWPWRAGTATNPSPGALLAPSDGHRPRRRSGGSVHVALPRIAQPPGPGVVRSYRRSRATSRRPPWRASVAATPVASSSAGWSSFCSALPPPSSPTGWTARRESSPSSPSGWWSLFWPSGSCRGGRPRRRRGRPTQEPLRVGERGAADPGRGRRRAVPHLRDRRHLAGARRHPRGAAAHPRASRHRASPLPRARRHRASPHPRGPDHRPLHRRRRPTRQRAAPGPLGRDLRPRADRRRLPGRRAGRPGDPDRLRAGAGALADAAGGGPPIPDARGQFGRRPTYRRS